LLTPRLSVHVTAGIDGAYFGTTFPHLFLMTFPPSVPPPLATVYIPRVFGFRIRRAAIPDEDAEEGLDLDVASGASGAAAAGGAGGRSGETRGGSGAPGSVRSVGPSGHPLDDGARAVVKPPRPGGGRTRELAVVPPTGPDGRPLTAVHDDFFDDDDDNDRPVAAAAQSSASAAAAPEPGLNRWTAAALAADGARPQGGDATAGSMRNGIHAKAAAAGAYPGVALHKAGEAGDDDEDEEEEEEEDEDAEAGGGSPLHAGGAGAEADGQFADFAGGGSGGGARRGRVAYQ
jgi:hypothetical protein